jgi:hypothetical protein
VTGCASLSATATLLATAGGFALGGELDPSALPAERAAGADTAGTHAGSPPDAPDFAKKTRRFGASFGTPEWYSMSTTLV